MDELLDEFIRHTADSFAQLDSDLAALDRSLRDPSTLGRIFNAVQTMKGTCSFLNLARIEALAHALESLLSRVCTADLGVTPELAGLARKAVERIRWLLHALDQTKVEAGGDDGDLIRELNALTQRAATEPAAAFARVNFSPTK